MKNSRLFKMLSALAALIIISAIIIFMTWDRIVVFFVARKYNISISYSSVRNQNFKELQFENLKAIDKKRGSGLYAAHARLWPSIGLQTETSKSLSFELKGVRFIPAPKKGPAKSDDYLMDIVALPFNGKWAYKDIYGQIDEHEKGVYIKKLVATGDAMRLSAVGYAYNNNTIDMNITIYFSKGLLKELPGSAVDAVLKDEPGEWKSLSANLTGDLKAPSIQLSGKLFRLNIRQIDSPLSDRKP